MDVIASDLYRAHETFELSGGQLVPSSESPRRAEIIVEALVQGRHEISPPARLDADLVNRVHDPVYVHFLETAWGRWQDRFGSDNHAVGFTWPARTGEVERPSDLVGQLGFHSFAADTAIGPGTWNAVAASAAAAQTAADRVGNGRRVAYAMCRPPGHHATRDQMGGYCYLNNAAIAAQRFLDLGAERVAVLDVDYHHGNGTQAIYERRNDVLTVSIHADPQEEFPWYAGHAHETGLDAGEGFNLNLPLPRGTDSAVWHSTLGQAIGALQSFGPSALVVSLGVDTFLEDPLGTFQLERADFRKVGHAISGLNLPTVIVQEGGYAVDDIGANVAAFLAGFE